MNKQFKFSSRQHPFARKKYKLFTRIYKKGVGACFYAHPGAVGLRIAPVTQDRQRSQPTPVRTI